MIARNSHNRSQAVILEPNPIKLYSLKRLKEHQSPHAFRFHGNYLQLEAYMQGITAEAVNSFAEADITVSGLEMKGMDRWGCVCTWMWGLVLLVPLILPVTDCWKRRVYPAESIDTAIYSKLAILLKSAHLQNLKLTVNDSNFNKEKAVILINLIRTSALEHFEFTNQAGAYDYEEPSYSTFQENMQGMTNLKAAVYLRWGGKVVQK